MKTLKITLFILFVLLLLKPAISAGEQQLRSPVISEDEALENFDFVWEKIRDTHFDKKLNGVDWDAVRDEFRPRAEQCRDIGELRFILRQMLSRLKQSHFGIIPSGEYTIDQATGIDALVARAFDAVPEHMGRPDVGIDVRVMDERIIVSEVREAGSAHEAGVRTGWTIVGINGYRIIDVADVLQKTSARYGSTEAAAVTMHMWSIVRDMLAGERGTQVEVVFGDSNDEETPLDLERRDLQWELYAIGGMPPLPVRVESRYLDAEAQVKIGLVQIYWIWLPATVAAFEDALADVADAEALIIDIRGNLGGVGQAAQGVAGFLTREQFSFGKSVGRYGEFPSIVSPRRTDRHGTPYEAPEIPIALLIDHQSGSTSELFAAGCQDAGLARLFGAPTAGAALPSTISIMPDGDKLLHAVQDFIRTNGERIEANPVQPDTFAEITRADLIAERDPALDAAIEWVLQHHVILHGGKP